MNYRLPDESVLPKHSSVNVGAEDDVSLFFGLSGTGKTTLPADPERTLIGDDEHGWDPDGVFNFEGGCCAKTIRLSAANEPEIFGATRRFGTILENVVYDLENVVYDPLTRQPDLDSDELTENTRAAFPLHLFGKSSPDGIASHPTTVIFLTADAFGVLPPISRLTRKQALYHFISGYTAKLAGTEVGLKEPQVTFSACFGAPFMPRHPGVYADMLGERLDAHSVPVWLINTGWSGGPYGVGSRMDIGLTRRMVHATLSDEPADVPTVPDPIFGVHVPVAVAGVPDQVLQPRQTWAGRDAYDVTARKLAGMFVEDLERFADGVSPAVAAV